MKNTLICSSCKEKKRTI